MQPAQVGGSPLGQTGGFYHEIAHGSASGGRPGQPADDSGLGLGATLRRLRFLDLSETGLRRAVLLLAVSGAEQGRLQAGLRHR